MGQITACDTSHFYIVIKANLKKHQVNMIQNILVSMAVNA